MSKIKIKKLVYIGFAFEHHKETQAGYHHIKEYLHYDKVIDCQRENEFLDKQTDSFFFKAFRKCYRTILGDGVPLTILKCILYSLTHRNIVFHFIYAENTYKWLHYFIGNTNKIVCTYHQPVDVIMKYPKWINDMKHINRIILMSSKEIEQFRQWSGKNNIYFIPHGINTGFYSPSNNVKKTSLLMVGNWMRDFEFANKVFKDLLKLYPDIEINVVTLESNYIWFNDLVKVNLYSKISDEELRNLYRKSKILFLPLVSYTANNAILEAASSGCKIVIATNNIDESYFNFDQVEYLPLNYDLVLRKLSNIFELNDDAVTSNELRKFVEERFSWISVSNKTKYILSDWN